MNRNYRIWCGISGDEKLLRFTVEFQDEHLAAVREALQGWFTEFPEVVSSGDGWSKMVFDSNRYPEDRLASANDRFMYTVSLPRQS